VAQVIDASVAIGWCAASQATSFTEAVLEAVLKSGGHVPAIFWFEVFHGLRGLEYRRIIPTTHIDEFAAKIADFMLMIDAASKPEIIIDIHRLARRYGLNIYDAAYLELALRLGLPLATRDASLARAAREAGVPLFSA
jgi:predicted nucleic acid-binding protein